MALGAYELSSYPLGTFGDSDLISGSIAAQEQGDSATASGKVYVRGTFALSESPDVASLAGNVVVSGIITTAEDADALSATARIIASGTLAATEEPDKFEGTNLIPITGTFTAAEQPDVLASTGDVLISGSFSLTEQPDTTSASGNTLIQGEAALVEQSDTVSGAGNVLISGAVVAQEQADDVVVQGAILISGALSILEDPDQAALRLDNFLPTIPEGYYAVLDLSPAYNTLNISPYYAVEPVNMTRELKIYTNSDNTYSLQFTVDGEPVDTTTFTNIEFVGNGVAVSTSALDAALYTQLADRLNIQLGLLALPLGRHYVTVRGYDLLNTEGVVFGHLVFRVLEDLDGN